MLSTRGRRNPTDCHEQSSVKKVERITMQSTPHCGLGNSDFKDLGENRIKSRTTWAPIIRGVEKICDVVRHRISEMAKDGYER